MASWATKRKFTYVSVGVIALFVIVALPTFKVLYKAPTCTDGAQNQGEQGIDCGGPCRTLCQSSFLPAVVVWADAQKIGPGLYNLGAYLENPNITGAATKVPYEFSVFDDQGILITQQQGTMDIPANRNTLAFIGAVDLGKRIPAKAGVRFQFLQAPLWRKAHDRLANLVYPTPLYTEDSKSALHSSSLQVTLTNTGLVSMNAVTVYAVLKDINDNEIDFSKTTVDQIAPGDKYVAPFTWPYSHDGKVVSEEILPIVAPVFDK